MELVRGDRVRERAEVSVLVAAVRGKVWVVGVVPASALGGLFLPETSRLCWRTKKKPLRKSWWQSKQKKQLRKIDRNGDEGSGLFV